MTYILAIDQGTTGSTANIVDSNGRSLGQVNHEYKQIYPKSGWVEHDPSDIWTSVRKAVSDVLTKTGVSQGALTAIGITNQRETVVVWDRITGEPVYNAIVWQCRRTAEFCESLKKRKLANLIQKKTGLVIDPYFSASKIRWILENVEGAKTRAKNGDLVFGNIDSFLIWRLTNGELHVTDVSNASRTQLMNIESLQWDDDMLELFGIPNTMLPKIVPSSGVVGATTNREIFSRQIPISGIAGDQQAALFGQTCFEAGDAKCTFGTGSFVLLNTGNQLEISKSGCVSTVAWQIGDQKPVYAMEGSAFICGAAVQWLRDGLGLIEKSSDVEALAKEVSSTDGVVFVPALAGLGAPHWIPEARGLLSGLSRGTTRAHIARAVLEGMALQNRDLMLAMEKDSGVKIKHLKVDGGATRNDLLMQMQSDFLNAAVLRPKNVESTSTGAAYLAGLGVGMWKNTKELKATWELDKAFEPQIDKKTRAEFEDRWHAAVKRTQ
ncbi:MAG: glycerol kinase [Bdellovibrionales bacterium CG10_big_fil_rev_8_21_14_0_10_45_34]|nr:MAG: glycerol kinase [Bdellovibrionales bacterium CG10_big_fil_rev_8_21_14_0_10_45_34]